MSSTIFSKRKLPGTYDLISWLLPIVKTKAKSKLDIYSENRRKRKIPMMSVET